VLGGEALHLYDTTGWREIARVVHSSEPINAAGFSPDGKRLATVSSHLGQLAVWNAEDGSLLRLTPSDPATSVAGDDPGAGVAFSSDGRRVASALGTVVDVETGATVSLQGRVRVGANVEMWFLPGDRTVAALTWYHSGDSWTGLVLEQFDAQSGSLLDSVGDDAALSADRSTVAGRAHWNQQLVVERLLPDGSRDRATYKNDAYAPFDSLKAVTAHGEALLVWVGGGIEARDAGDPTRTLSRVELPPGMAFVAMSPADEVVTAGPCGTVAWNWRTGAAVWAQPFAIRQIAWGAGGALTSAVGPGALWRVWRTDTGLPLCTAPGGRAITRRLFSPDGGTVAFVYDDGRIELRDADLANPRPLNLSGAAAGGQMLSLGRGGRYAAVWEANSPTSSVLMVADTITGRTSAPLPLDGTLPPTALVTADGRRLAYKSSFDLRLVDVESGAVLLDDDQNDWLVGFDPDERRMAIQRLATSGSQTILTYATADGAPGETFATPGQRVIFEALAPDWSFAIGSSEDMMTYAYTTLRWPLAGGAVQPLSTRARAPLGGFSVSTDGALFFDRGAYFHEFTGDHLELNVTDAATGAEVEDFVDHDVSPSADGRRLFGQGGALFCR
jgi:WD40 repeat protein